MISFRQYDDFKKKNISFQKYCHLSQFIAIDESMIQSEGSTSLKQYMPKNRSNMGTKSGH